MALEIAVGGKMTSSNAAMIETLPSDVMVRVNEFLKLPDRIRLASCNKTLQRVVFQECVPLWREIDFSNVDDAKQLLTDAMLASLLTRVNAKTVTKSLSIDDCENLVGTGLEPLKESEVLEKIDMRDLVSFSLDVNVIVPILRTMIPFKLKHVFFRPTRFRALQSTAPCEFTNFLSELWAARLQQAREAKLICSACKTPVANDARQLVPNGCGVPPSLCGTCSKHFCRHSSCDIGLVDCDFCGDTSCDECAKVERCSICLCYSCEPCEVLITCNCCPKRSCIDCFYNSNGETCGDCDKHFCGVCRGQHPDLANSCDWCWEAHCSDCLETKFCVSCQEDVCVKSTDSFLECDLCSKGFCCPCDEANWHVHHCGRCNKNVCNDCRDQQDNLFGYCESCSEDFCGACRETKVCDSCESSFCVQCVNFQQCDACDKLFCEKCRTKNGCCHTCDEKPSKKARTSY